MENQNYDFVITNLLKNEAALIHANNGNRNLL